MPVGQAVADHLAEDFFPGVPGGGAESAGDEHGQQQQNERPVFHGVSLQGKDGFYSDLLFKAIAFKMQPGSRPDLN
jgi:hypothetical protein